MTSANPRMIDSVDDWAERTLAARIARASHSRATADDDRVEQAQYREARALRRQAPPSAFSGAGSRLPAPADEELPPGREEGDDSTFVPEPEAGGDFELDGAEFGDELGSDCADCDGPFDSATQWNQHCHGNWCENLSVFGGAQAFKGPIDQGRNGNFGLHEGLNWGEPLWRAARIGYQLGGQVVHSNFSGNNVIAPSAASRTQLFTTVGIFQRAIASDPWQWGVAWDWLSDQYYVNTQFSRVRAELSFVGSTGDEIGFWTSIGGKSKTTSYISNNQAQSATFVPADLYAFFYRRHFGNGATGRLWAGFTGYRDGLLGGDFRVPLSPAFALLADANYLVPAHNSTEPGTQRESWALSINLVWYPGVSALSSVTSPWRPLFNVGDNSIFMLHRR